MAIRDSIFDGILQMQVIPFFRELLSPNFVRFLFGFTEAKACVEMSGFHEFACGPEEYGFVLAPPAELNCVLQEFFPDAKPSGPVSIAFVQS
jgi:hypothetical protein